nr:TolC family protein [Pseudothauera rhizosphaerae]
MLAAVLASSPAAQADGAALGASVAGLLDYARSRNPDFAASTLEAGAAQARVDAAGALPDPRFQVELMDFTNTMNGRSTSLLPGQVGETRYRVIQPLPGWGKRDLARQAAEARAGQADAQRETAWSELSAEIGAAWLRYYGADRELGLQRDALLVLQGLEETALSRYRLGQLPQQAVLRAQREITAQRIALLAAEQRRKGLATALNGLLARVPDAALAEPADPPTLPERLDFAELVERARQRNPGVLTETLGVDVARAQREQTYRERYPDFSVGFTHNRPDEGKASWDLMFEVMIPLQQGSRRAQEREAEYMLSAADARRAAVANRVAAELGAAWAAYASGLESLRLLRGTLLPQAEATRDATRAAFAGGRADFDGVLEAERQWIEARTALLGAEVDARMALNDMEKLAGETK